MEWAYRLTSATKLADDASLAKIRIAYRGFPNALRPPFVLRGDAIAGDRCLLGRAWMLGRDVGFRIGLVALAATPWLQKKMPEFSSRSRCSHMRAGSTSSAFSSYERAEHLAERRFGAVASECDTFGRCSRAEFFISRCQSYSSRDGEMQICRIVHRKTVFHRERVRFHIPAGGFRWNGNDVQLA